jgi:glycosyltransferase involved in cell wall biosynthesis
MTADTVGGVWTYTQELVTGLTRRGIRVTLASFGAMPRPEQLSWMEGLENLDYRPTSYRLEWMQDAERDVQESRAYLADLIAEVRPDLLHSNQYCFGNLGIGLRCVVVAHSDVVSWWVGVHGHEPADEPWIRWYRQVVTAGLQGADVVVAPSHFMLDCVRRYYYRPNFGAVIYNGRTPALFDPRRHKDSFVLTVGRLWDQAKQVGLLLEQEQSTPVCVVGCNVEPSKPEFPSQSSGEKSPDQLRELFADAPIYAATSCYEPFGLAPLEAALSRCAIVANDIASFREVWGDSVCYFRKNDAHDLAEKIKLLSSIPAERTKYGGRAYRHALANYTAEKMVYQYEALYQTACEMERVA